jgi:GDP-L-fucose synthase
MKLNNLQNKKIFITGHNGMLGKEIIKLFETNNFNKLITASRNTLDLRNQNDVSCFFEKEKPEIVLHLAAKVGGINANINFPGEFIYDNIIMQSNVINASRINSVKLFLFVGSSCIYPTNCPQPMSEEFLLNGKLEPTNEGYAISKIAGIKMLEAYKSQYGFNSICLMPSNLYGPNDSFDPNHSHVLSALVKKVVDAKYNNIDNINIWGSGIARREFLHVSDFANAILYFLNLDVSICPFVNIGTGKDISIKDLLEIIIKEVEYSGSISWDTSKSDGMLRKCLDVSKMQSLGFNSEINLIDGIREVINEYKIKNNYL